MILEIINSLVGLLPALGDESRERREVVDNALRAISHALQETYIYYSRYERMGRDREIEEQLVRYWAAAAIPLRHIDLELAQICERKSEYWLNPENYAPNDVRSLGIELERVRTQYRQHLVGRVRRSRISNPQR